MSDGGRRRDPADGSPRVARTSRGRRRRREPRRQHSRQDRRAPGAAGASATRSGYSDGLSALGVDVPGDDHRDRGRDARTPRSAHSGERPRVGPVPRALGRAGRRARARRPRRASPSDEHRGAERRGVVASSRPYMPTHEADEPGEQQRGGRCARARRDACRCGRSPRESIAAASRNDRSSASCSTGIAIRARTCRPRPRRRRAARRARRTRCALSTSCGATVSATVIATPSSYSAPGSDCSSALRVRERVGRADAAGAASRGGSRRRPRRARSRLTGPPRRTPAAAGQRDSGSVKSTCSRRTRAAEHDPEHDADRDHDERRERR